MPEADVKVNITANASGFIKAMAGVAMAMHVLGRSTAQTREYMQALANGRIPPAIRGGTFLYCPWNNRHMRSGGWAYKECGVRKPGWATGTRFRSEKDYRRHWGKHFVSNA